MTIRATTFIHGLAYKVELLMGKFRHFATPMNPTYHPEIDETSLLVGNEIGMYRMLVGSLQ